MGEMLKISDVTNRYCDHCKEKQKVKVVGVGKVPSFRRYRFITECYTCGGTSSHFVLENGQRVDNIGANIV